MLSLQDTISVPDDAENHHRIFIKGVTKKYADHLALDRVDLELKQNSFTCLLGPSGCGKSTLLNMIAGFITPTSGEIWVDGTRVTGPGPDRGVVFQEYALFPWRTVMENVAFGPMLKGHSRLQQRDIALTVLERVGLLPYQDRLPRDLSGGMKQRVAIARALANNPTVLLMDEPFGALDAQTRESLQEEMKRIWQQERKTVIFVTHSISEAIFLADKIVVMGTQPGHIKKVIDVNLIDSGNPLSQDFVALAAELRKLIKHEAAKNADA
ncbi:ABC transporter ATP-binding protein [Sodalis sp. RH22]|uniref:ABC transporter ATP-binding protein n=1 Tax=unclassified Sodalis (in: enterobacteria) TaxID=2636512 RepID=UPI0039B47DEE